MNEKFKKLLTWAGSIVAVAGILFVGIRLNGYRTQLDFSQFDVFIWPGIFLLTGVYGTASILLALAWREILTFYGETRPKLWAIKIYGLTQLAKYVPSNIMHFAGRQAMGLAADIGGWILAKSTLWELALLALSGSLFSILTVPLLLPQVNIALSVITFVIVVLIVAILLKNFAALPIAKAFLGHTIFLSISSIIFVIILILLHGTAILKPTQFSLCFGAFIVAWLAGLVTPGAPAGIGVREAMILLLLNNVLPESQLLIAVLLSRIITVGGDVFFFCIASACSNNLKRTTLFQRP